MGSVLLALSATTSTASVQALIDDAVARGENHIVLPAGEHRIDGPLRLEKLTGFTLDGPGAILVFTSLKDGGLSVSDCAGVTLRGFTIDFDPLPFTQGTIGAIDRDKGLVTYTVHEGYPDLAPGYGGHRAHVFDPRTLAWKKGAPDIYATSARRITPRRGELSFAPDRRWQLASLSPGDYLVQDARRGRGIRIEHSRDITVEGVTVWSAPGLAMACRFMDGRNRFSYTVVRGPLPPGASVPRLLSSSADGFNYAYARTGPVVENCDFSFMGDDSVNIHGIAFAVAETKGTVIRLIRPYGREGFASVIRPGDEVRSIAQGNFDLTGSSRVVSFSPEPAASPRLSPLAPVLFPLTGKSGHATIYRLEVSDPLPLKTGDFVAIPAIAAPGYVIRDNHFSRHRGRALRLMGSHGLIENNTIEGIKQAAITLGAEFVGFREAGWVENVIVRGNTIRDSCFDPILLRGAAYTPGAISVIYRGETPGLPRPVRARNRNIRIENNTIEDVGGPAIHINQAANVLIKGNTLARTNQIPAASRDNPCGLTTSQPIDADGSDGVVIEP